MVQLSNLVSVLKDSQLKMNIYQSQDFKRFILSCLRPKLVKEDLSSAELIAE